MLKPPKSGETADVIILFFSSKTDSSVKGKVNERVGSNGDAVIFLFFPEFRGRDTFVSLEVAAEGGLVRESEADGYLLHGQLWLMTKQGLGLNHDIAANPLAGGDACLLFDDGGKVFGSKAEQVSIETHFTTFAEVLYNGLVETDEEFLPRRQWAVFLSVFTAVILQ